MRRALSSTALVLVACGAGEVNAPPSPPPAASSATPAPPPETIAVTVDKGVVIARDKGDKELFRVTIKGARRAIPAPGKGAFVLGSSHVMRLDPRGKERWKSEVKQGHELFAARDYLLVSTGGRAQMFEIEDGIDHGVILADDAGVERRANVPLTSYRVPLRLFPGYGGRAARSLAVDPSGLMLTGAADGSLVAIDFDGVPMFQLGVRGAVQSIEPRDGGPARGFNVVTAEGRFIVDPVARTVVEPSPPPLAVLSHLSHEARPVERAPQIVLGKDDAWALEKRFDPDPREDRLHHFDGDTWSPLRAPQLNLMANPVLTGQSELAAYTLGRGPNGQLLVIGLEQLWSKVAPAMESIELRVLERAGKGLRDRADLKVASKMTAQHMESSPPRPTYAAGSGGREVICISDTCVAKGLSPSFRIEGAEPPKPAGPSWVLFEWPDGGMWWEPKPITFAGEVLWRLDGSGLYRDGKKVSGAPSLDRLSDEFGPGEGSSLPARALWASGPNDVWVSSGVSRYGSFVMRWDGASLTRVKTPLRWTDHIAGRAPDDVWFSGDGVAHYDGKEIRRVAGVPDGPIVAGASNEMWIGDWRVVPIAAPLSPLSVDAPSVPPVAAPSASLDVSAIEPRIRLERAAVDVPGEGPLEAALGAGEGPNGLVWLHDRLRVVEYDGSNAKLLYRAKAKAPLDGRRSIAVKGAGEGVFLAAGPDRMTGLFTLSSGRARDALWLPRLLGVASAYGQVWAVSASEDDSSPRAVVLTSQGTRAVHGLPPAAYVDVTAISENDVWFAGGLTTLDDRVRAEPAGEGVLVSFNGRLFQRYRGPEGALLAVGHAGKNEVWAVGLDGGLLRFDGKDVHAYHLERGGARLRVALRAVSVRAPNDVWIAGDQATLLHWDGATMKRIDTAALGPETALTAVIAPGQAPGWVVGPKGMWRIKAAR